MATAKRVQKSSAAKKIHDAAWIRRQIEAFSTDIAAQPVLDQAMIVGIRRRGAELARRVREQVRRLSGRAVPYGALDVTLYRDDLSMRGPRLPAPREGTQIEESLDNRVVFLIDDVLCTGRTIRAALDELTDFGRPGSVRLYSLIDRGGRELPIQPDRVGQRMAVSSADRVDVRLKEVDGEEGVYVLVGGMR